MFSVYFFLTSMSVIMYIILTIYVGCLFLNSSNLTEHNHWSSNLTNIYMIYEQSNVYNFPHTLIEASLPLNTCPVQLFSYYESTIYICTACTGSYTTVFVFWNIRIMCTH
jgi:hypothetical protein